MANEKFEDQYLKLGEELAQQTGGIDLEKSIMPQLVRKSPKGDPKWFRDALTSLSDEIDKTSFREALQYEMHFEEEKQHYSEFGKRAEELFNPYIAKVGPIARSDPLDIYFWYGMKHAALYIAIREAGQFYKDTVWTKYRIKRKEIGLVTDANDMLRKLGMTMEAKTAFEQIIANSNQFRDEKGLDKESDRGFGFIPSVEGQEAYRE